MVNTSNCGSEWNDPRDAKGKGNGRALFSWPTDIKAPFI